MHSKRRFLRHTKRIILIATALVVFGTAAVASGQQLYKIVSQANETETAVATSESSSARGGGATVEKPSTAQAPAAAPTPAPPTTSTAVPTTTTPAPQATTPKKTTPTPAPAPTPTPTPAPTPTPSPTPSGTELASESQCPGQSNVGATSTVLVCLTSYARQFYGLSAVGANSNLMTAAGHKAADIQSCGFSHTACGRAFGYWITTDGYNVGCYAENIAQGQQTPLDVFTAWMNSAGHRANILHASYKDIGVSYLANNGSPIWVMHLGGC